MKRSYYQNSIKNFIKDNPNSIFGQLSQNHQHSLEDLQKNAWTKQIDILKSSLADLKGNVYFEFSIPRMGERVDNIVIVKDLIFVIEFKIGDKQYLNYAQNQTIDYCLDLMNFHEGSQNKNIIPILVATKGNKQSYDFNKARSLEKCILCNENNLGSVINEIVEGHSSDNSFDYSIWENSSYKPTPTIIEAAQALYKGHNVSEISRNDSGAINLSKTTDSINKIIEKSKKII